MTSPEVENMPPIDWFRDPHLNGPTPLTVEADGRVYGHMALWDTDHVGFSDQSVRPPRSQTDYGEFHVGAADVIGDDGDVVRISAGVLTMGTGHADLNVDALQAAAHYDNTGSIAARVCAGEDEFGIWVSGDADSGLDEVSRRRFMASGLSGDWRPFPGLAEPEMVAVLSVPTPGFPIPRARVAAGGEPVALIAAGALPPRVEALAAAAKPAAKSPAKPAAKKPAAGGSFNSKHPRGKRGSPNGGKFVSLGKARDGAAAAAQNDPKARGALNELIGTAPGARAALLKSMSDAYLQALSRTAYSGKTSDPKIVAARIAIANALAKRGMDVKKFGALGGGPAARKAPAKAPAKKAPVKAAPKKPVAKKPAPKKAPVKKKAVAAAGTVTASRWTSGEDNHMPVTLTDEQLVAMRDALGLAEDADADALTAALTEAFAESGEGEGDAEEVEAPVAVAASLPPGIVAIDSTQLDALRAAAQRGDEARSAQERDERQSLVASAIQDGRIPPARRDHWIAQLEADPGVSAVLASMAPGLIPTGSPIGHANDSGDLVADALFASVFPEGS